MLLFAQKNLDCCILARARLFPLKTNKPKKKPSLWKDDYFQNMTSSFEKYNFIVIRLQFYSSLI